MFLKMASQSTKDFKGKLSDLYNWQIEQKKKLEEFQEVQKRLVNDENRTVLSDLLIPKSSCNRSVNSDIPNDNLRQDYETLQILKYLKNCELFQHKNSPIKLQEPKIIQAEIKGLYDKDSSDNEDFNENYETEKNFQPRKFLKRGDGLARFRMKLDDFKGVPKIYKENRIKTHLNKKPESFKNRISSKTSKNVNSGKAAPVTNVKKKTQPLAVNIYVPDTKPKKLCYNENFQAKPNFCSFGGSKIQELKLPGVSTEKLSKKNSNAALSDVNKPTYKNTFEEDSGKVSEYFRTELSKNLETEAKKDEKELKVFEILEKKVDDVSFCSNSSVIDKLMELSTTSTPSKIFEEKSEKPYAKSLRSLHSQFLEESQIKRYKELDDSFDLENWEDKSKNQKNTIRTPSKESLSSTDTLKTKVDYERLNVNDMVVLCEPKEPVLQETVNNEIKVRAKNQSQSDFKKTLLQDYVKNFKKFKSTLRSEVTSINTEQDSEKEEEVKLKDQNVRDNSNADECKGINQHEIALKMQRKGLQDNVKHLLNWEQPKKKVLKKVVKKNKPRPVRVEKPRPNRKDHPEKIIFNSSLLKERLEELEKEIDIFRKENRKVEKLQRECQEERIKLAKERKEFEKAMQEEKEKFESKMSESLKKLQKERTVFETYCKQTKSKPNRQEREEIALLKKEIEKLTESMTTKEGRWGASQARLRNQMRNLEKENSNLKSENEKLRKTCSKKVSFENEKSVNAKIIEVINSELEKLKPTALKSRTSSTKPQSARINRNIEEKPLRRINSAPNIKRQVVIECNKDGLSEFDEKFLGSVSTDSGIDINAYRVNTSSESTKNKPLKNVCQQSRRGLISREDDLPEQYRKTFPESCIDSCDSGFSVFAKQGVRKSTSDARVISALQESIFDDVEVIELNKLKDGIEELNLSKPSNEKCVNKHVRRRGVSSNEDSGESDSEEKSEDECGSTEECIEKSDFISKNRDSKDVSDAKNLRKPPTDYCENYFEDYRMNDSTIRNRIHDDGTNEIFYPNGNIKKIFPGGKITKMVYYNGDIKETNLENGSEKYYYSETKTWHTTYKDGLEVLEFSNGQTERRYADGSTEISFPNGCVRYCDAQGRDEWRFQDGTVIKTNENGHKILLMPNGQKEIHTKEFKKREYPDGTIKIVFADGTQETRYATGRVRLKDKLGNLLMDSGGI